MRYESLKVHELLVCKWDRLSLWVKINHSGFDRRRTIVPLVTAIQLSGNRNLEQKRKRRWLNDITLICQIWVKTVGRMEASLGSLVNKLPVTQQLMLMAYFPADVHDKRVTHGEKV